MPEMDIRDVVTNLKNFECWDFKHYELRKEEAEAIIRAFEGESENE